jgi:hypothetical protein
MTDEVKVNGLPLSQQNIDEARRLNERLKTKPQPPERLPTNASLEQYVAQFMGRSCRPEVATAVLTVPQLPKVTGDDLFNGTYHPFGDRTSPLARERISVIEPPNEFKNKQKEEVECQTEPASRPTVPFFTSLGKFTGFNLMANMLRKLLRRTSNSSN